MKLVSLALELYRQHRETVIELREGVTGIIGVNGSGKTSLVEAIAFALYGTRVIRGRVEDLVSRGAPPKSEPKVTLVFEHDGVGYRIERTTGGAELFVGGEAAPVANGTREVTARISRLLGMTHEEFSATFYTEQKGLEFLGGQRGGAERERFIVRTLGYDRLEKIQELVRADRREVRGAVAGIEASLGVREEIEKRLADEQRKLAEAELVEREAARQLTELEAEYEQHRKRFLALDAERQAAESVRQELTRREMRYADAAGRARTVEAELRDLRERVAAFGDLAPGADAAARAARLLEAAEGAAADLASAELAASELEQGWRERLANGRAEYGAAERSIAELRAKLTRGAELDAAPECPTCGQPIGTEFERLRQELGAELARREESLAALAVNLEHASRSPLELNDARTRRDAIKIAAEAARERCREHERAAAELAEHEGELEAVRSVLAETDRELRALRRELGEARFSEDEFRGARAKFESSRGLTEVKRLERVRAEGEVARLRSLIDRSQSELAAHDERARMLRERRHLLLVLDEADRVLIEFRKHLNASLRPQLAELASFFLADLTDGRYASLELSEDFTPRVIEDGSPKPVISGGEEDIVNLSLRLALSQMIAERSGNSLSLLVLDEIFGALDDVRRGNVLALLEKLRTHFEQILVITHIEDVKEAVQNVIAIEYDEATGELDVSPGSPPAGEVAFNF